VQILPFFFPAVLSFPADRGSISSIEGLSLVKFQLRRMFDAKGKESVVSATGCWFVPEEEQFLGRRF